MGHGERFTGQSLKEKCDQIAKHISDGGSEATVLTMTDSIAWLLNLRGGDIEFTPLVLAFAILHRNSCVDLFMDVRKCTPDLFSHLGNQVTIHPPEAFSAALNRLKDKTKQIQIDPATASDWICRQLAGGKAKLVEATDPCALPKAIGRGRANVVWRETPACSTRWSVGESAVSPARNRRPRRGSFAWT